MLHTLQCAAQEPASKQNRNVKKSLHELITGKSTEIQKKEERQNG